MQVLQWSASSLIVVDAITLDYLFRDPDHILAERENQPYEIFEVKNFFFSVIGHLLKPIARETIWNQPSSGHKYS